MGDGAQDPRSGPPTGLTRAERVGSGPPAWRACRALCMECPPFSLFLPACTSDVCVPFLGVIIHSPKDRALTSLGQTPPRVLSLLPSHHDLARRQEDVGSEQSGLPQADQLARGHGDMTLL